MYNPEKEYINSFSRKEELTETESRVIPEVCSRFGRSRPQLDEFEDIYSTEEIRGDKQKVKKAEREHMEHTERSNFFEAVLAEHLENSEWLGEDVVISPTAKYDDFFNGVDMVAEFGAEEKGSDAPKLAIDATTGVDASACDEKMKRMKEKISEGELASLKYFSSSEPDYNPQKGEVDMIPKVVVGEPVEEVKKLAERVKDVMDKKPGASKEMGNAYVQIELLEEMLSQLEAFIGIAKKEGFNEEDTVVSKQKEVFDILNGILEEKKRSIGVPDEARKNSFYKSLTEEENL